MNLPADNEASPAVKQAGREYKGICRIGASALFIGLGLALPEVFLGARWAPEAVLATSAILTLLGAVTFVIGKLVGCFAGKVSKVDVLLYLTIFFSVVLALALTSRPAPH